MLRLLVEAKGRVNATNHAHATPLFLAAQEGWPGAVDILVNQLGADMHIPTTAGFYPLHIGAQNGYPQSVRVLTEASCDPNIMGGPDLQKMSPLFMAARSGHADVAKELIQMGATPTQGFHMLGPGGVPLVRFTPLMMAKEVRHAAVVKVLEDCGCRAVKGEPRTLNKAVEQFQTKLDEVRLIAYPCLVTLGPES